MGQYSSRNVDPGAGIFTELFIKAIPDQYAHIQDILRTFRKKDPSRPVVIVNEGTFFGPVVFKYGVEGPQPDAIIGVGIIPLLVSSVDLAWFGSGLPPATTPETREQYAAMRKKYCEGDMGPAQVAFEEAIVQLGAKERPSTFAVDASVLAPDRFIQMCIPELEYPRSDMPSNVRFAGGLPRGGRYRGAETEKPAWWSDVIETGKEKRRGLVFVSQGTVATDYTHLIMPTIASLADSDDIVVVAALGKRGATLPEDFPIPKNAHVADYIPFDDLLEHADVFVTNGGYGGFQHAVSHGVPLVIGGETEDKPEVAARAEWAGVGVNLRTGKPSEEQVRTAVREVLSNSKFKARALEIKKEMEKYDPYGVIVQNIEEVVGGLSK